MKHTLWPLALFVLAAPITASMAQQPPLICFGNELSWRLDLTEPEPARFSTPDSGVVDFVGAATTIGPRKESVWRGRAAAADGGDLVAFLREGACSDQMSDVVHPFSVNVSLPDGRHLSGCCRLSDAPADSASLEGATWRLTELPGQTLSADGPGDAVTVTFESGRVHGFSGCNRFTGSYSLDGVRLVLGSLGGTMMACPEPAMSVERAVLGAFSGTLNVSVHGDGLVLSPADGGDALRFKREVPPGLEETAWEVTGYNNGRQAVVSPMPGTRLTLMFRDGEVTGDGGCNRFHGSYTLEANALTIHPLAITRRARAVA